MAAQQPPPPPTTRHAGLNALLVKEQAQITEIEEYDGLLINFDVEYAPDGPIFTFLAKDNLLETFTNFNPNIIQDIYQTMESFIADSGTRGPKCASSTMDQVICYFLWGKLGSEYDKLGRQFSIKPNRMQKNIDRARLLVNKTMRYRWLTP